MIISSKNTKKVAEESKLFCAIFRNAVGSNSTLCQFCTCWVHERCNGIRHKVEKMAYLNERYVQISKQAYQWIVQVQEKSPYLCHKVRAGAVAADTVMKKAME